MLQSVRGAFIFPQFWLRTGAANLSNVTLAAAGEALALIFQAPASATIDRIGFLTGAITTGGTVTCTIEGVSTTTGDPDGTPIGSGTVVVADTDDNVWKECTLSSTAAVTRAGVYAAVITVPSGFNGALRVAGTVADFGGGWNFPYKDQFTAAAWSKTNDSPCINVRHDDGTYPVLGHLPMSNISATVFNSGSTPDERGLIFQLPFPCRCIGAIVHGAYAGGGTLKLYDSDGSTVLTSLAVDPDQQQTANNGPAQQLFPDSVSLAKDTQYRLTLLPSTTTGNTLTDITVQTAAMMDAFPGGQAWQLTTRTDGGSWTETPTQRPLISLLLDAFDDAAQNAGAVHIRRLLGLLGVGR